MICTVGLNISCNSHCFDSCARKHTNLFSFWTSSSAGPSSPICLCPLYFKSTPQTNQTLWSRNWSWIDNLAIKWWRILFQFFLFKTASFLSFSIDITEYIQWSLLRLLLWYFRSQVEKSLNHVKFADDVTTWKPSCLQWIIREGPMAMVRYLTLR